MNILYITSEAAPFCKTGGLADVLGSLPPAVAAEGDIPPCCCRCMARSPSAGGRR